ncbi:hypothetical protein PBY51_012769 [Eleginops maclovinus]|uniref:Uncharacterized protein n=1 Tax=Eleginops maclovinus TaxID=56733 RepID=A0AAN7Y3R1_ELEMC|nr:hypothetical protein PBY51_012769 [Eleginops maclovinus]
MKQTGFMYTASKVSEIQPGPDSQTRTSSCELSVRCVRSQRGSRTPITAALSRHRFSRLSPLIKSTPAGPPVCRSH